MLQYHLMKICSKFFCLAPGPLRKGAAAALGRIALWVTPHWRMEMAAANVRDCLGLEPAAAAEVAKESVRRFGRMIIEVLRFPLLKADELDRWVEFEGWELYEAAAAENKGVIMCTGHFGNWELLGGAIALKLGQPLLSIARKQNNSQMDRFIHEYRELVGQKLVYNHGGHSLMAISRMVKEKHHLGVVYDQDTNDGGVATKLFGKACAMPVGPAALSRTYGSPILPVFIHNRPDGTSVARCHPAFHTPRTADKEADLAAATAYLVKVLEREVKEDPAMWFWAHDRWKDGRKRFGGGKK